MRHGGNAQISRSEAAVAIAFNTSLDLECWTTGTERRGERGSNKKSVADEHLDRIRKFAAIGASLHGGYNN
jgi:hypothetical protein